MIKVGLLQPGLFTSYIRKEGEFLKIYIYILLVRFGGHPEIEGPGAWLNVYNVHIFKWTDFLNNSLNLEST